MCFGGSSSHVKPELPDAPSGETRTFYYGPEGKVKTGVEIPKKSKASGHWTPYKKTKKKGAANALNIPTEEPDIF